MRGPVRWWYLLALMALGACVRPAPPVDPWIYAEGGIVRGDTTRPTLALVFTGDEYADGGAHIRDVLARHGVPASFFFTGQFYRNAAFAPLIRALKADGHYLGAHSDAHLLYCSWDDRARTLVSPDSFFADLDANYDAMRAFGVERSDAPYFLPPFEWYNATISAWTAQAGLHLVNFTPGTRANADYTTPDLGPRYVPSTVILDSILDYEATQPNGLNGFLLLLHVGTAPARTDKFYHRLDTLIASLHRRGYAFVRVDSLLTRSPEPRLAVE